MAVALFPCCTDCLVPPQLVPLSPSAVCGAILSCCRR